MAVAEGLAEAVAEGKVGGVDGVEGDEVHLFEVGLAVGGKEFFIADDVDDFGHKVEAGFGFVVFLDDAALEGQGEVVVKGCVDVGYNTPRFSDRHNYGGMTNNRYICKKKKIKMARQSKFTASFKAKVAVEALKETEPLESLAKKYGVAPSKITEWKNELLNNADKAFVKDTESKSELKKVTAEKDRLLKKVGQLTIDCDFFAKACEDAGLKVR